MISPEIITVAAAFIPVTRRRITRRSQSTWNNGKLSSLLLSTTSYFPSSLSTKESEEVSSNNAKNKWQHSSSPERVALFEEAIISEEVKEGVLPIPYYDDVQIIDPSLSLSTCSRIEKETTTTTTKRNRRSWDDSFKLLIEYYKQHGNVDVPFSYPKDPKLGRWVDVQRKRHNQLPANKITKLNILNFNWDGCALQQQRDDKKWQQMFGKLVQYKTQTGHCNVPGSGLKLFREQSSCGGEYGCIQYTNLKELSYWVQTQRRLYTNSSPTLTPYRIQKLESIGFEWRFRGPVVGGRTRKSDLLDTQWDDKFEELVLFQKEHGHCNVPSKYKPNPSLAKWVTRQRYLNRKNNAAGGTVMRLRSDRKERLDEIGFVWDFEDIRDEIWLNMYNQLLQLLPQQQQEDDEVVAATTTTTKDPKKKRSSATWSRKWERPELYEWENRQHASYLRGTMIRERKELLEEIGYWKSLGIIV